MTSFDSQITFAIPSDLDLQAMEFPNVSVLLSGMDDLDFNKLTRNLDHYNTEVNYRQFMGDVWVGVVLTLMIVTSIFCMCACFLYHKFRMWKASVRHFQTNAMNLDHSLESGSFDSAYDTVSLPSYTLASGLPSYEDALDCHQKIQAETSSKQTVSKIFTLYPLIGGAEPKDTLSGELQQVTIVDNKDGLPSYQESLVTIVNEQKRSPNVKRSFKPILPIKGNLTVGGDANTTHANGDEGSQMSRKRSFMVRKSKKQDSSPQIHKTQLPAMVLDEDYWRSVQQNQNQQQIEGMLSPSGSRSSNS